MHPLDEFDKKIKPQGVKEGSFLVLTDRFLLDGDDSATNDVADSTNDDKDSNEDDSTKMPRKRQIIDQENTGEIWLAARKPESQPNRSPSHCQKAKLSRM